MADKKQRLRDIIAEKSLLSGSFTLASGKASLTGELLAELIAGDAETKAVGGLEMGAVPIALSIAMKSHEKGRRLDAFFVRKEVKDHGTAKLIDGNFAPGSKVVILEDVTTTGGSAMKAVKAVRDQGGKVDTIVTIVDRLEGARENLKKEGLELVSLFTNDDFKR
jgi:orotate phosphoribosyltransferase